MVGNWGIPEDPLVGAVFHVCAQFSLDQVQLGDACSVGAQLWLCATGFSNDVHFGMFSEVRYYSRVIRKVCPEEETEGKFHQNWD